MNPEDRQAQIERYSALFQEFGYSSRSLDLGQDGRQALRYRVLAEPALRQPESSVLDVGCGFADLYAYLKSRGWRGTYTGLDIVPGFVEAARERHPALDVRLQDITAPEPAIEPHDFVIAASGVFNARLQSDNNAHTRRGLAAMAALAKQAVSVDFLSTEVDFQKPEAWHTDPVWALAEARKLAPRVVLRMDYMPYEFALILYVRGEVSRNNVFVDFERIDHV